MKKTICAIFLSIMCACLCLTGCNTANPTYNEIKIENNETVQMKLENSKFLKFKVRVSSNSYAKYYQKQQKKYGDDTMNMMFSNYKSEVEKLQKLFNEPSKNASVKFLNNYNNPFEYIEETNGKEINTENLRKQVLQILDGEKDKIDLQFVQITSDLSTQDLVAKTQLRGAFSTYFGTSTANRKENIKVASNKLSGLIINPHQQLSFNEVVGRRTAENGFKSSLIILNGEYVEGIGGGVCQVSTTLYNAWVNSGLEVAFVQSHSLPTSYVDLSFDATVSSQIDLKLKNDTEHPVYLLSQIKNDTLYFAIYGAPNPYDIKKITKIVKEIDTIPFTDIYDTNKYVVEKGKKGFVTKGIIEYYIDKKLVKKVERDDYYTPTKDYIIEKTATPQP
ncbi:MAG: VanW family protein [Clostridia bacterium]